MFKTFYRRVQESLNLRRTDGLYTGEAKLVKTLNECVDIS